MSMVWDATGRRRLPGDERAAAMRQRRCVQAAAHAAAGGTWRAGECDLLRPGGSHADASLVEEKPSSTKKPVKCAKGKRLSHGRCVKRNRKSRRSRRNRRARDGRARPLTSGGRADEDSCVSPKIRSGLSPAGAREVVRARWCALGVAAAVVLAVLACAAPSALAVNEAGFGAPEFGTGRLGISERNQDGSPSTQAGAHPFALTTTFVLNQPPRGRNHQGVRRSEGSQARNAAGLRRQPQRRTRVPLSRIYSRHNLFERNRCWGRHDLDRHSRSRSIFAATSDPVYNLVPPTGIAAEFGYIVAEKHAGIPAEQPTGGDRLWPDGQRAQHQ